MDTEKFFDPPTQCHLHYKQKVGVLYCVCVYMYSHYMCWRVAMYLPYEGNFSVCLVMLHIQCNIFQRGVLYRLIIMYTVQ